MLLIDGDILVYRAGFATQKEKEALFAGKYNLSKMIMSMIGDLQVSHYRIFLSGANNFRKTIATILPYKGNRNISNRPIHYDALREELITYWKAEVINDMEADDALGIEQMKGLIYENKEGFAVDSKTIICTIDKDLNMIPGWHYNFVKKQKFFIDEKLAYKNFYKQVLIGDAVDNIPGLKGIGDKGAEKLLDGLSIQEMNNKINVEYLSKVKSVQDKYEINLKGINFISKADTKENFVNHITREIKELLWIRRGNQHEDMHKIINENEIIRIRGINNDNQKSN
jgi:hypothetical protein